MVRHTLEEGGGVAKAFKAFVRWSCKLYMYTQIYLLYLSPALMKSPNISEQLWSFQGASLPLVIRERDIEYQVGIHQGGVSQKLPSVTYDSFCYKLLKSLLLIGYHKYKFTDILLTMCIKVNTRSNGMSMNLYLWWFHEMMPMVLIAFKVLGYT